MTTKSKAPDSGAASSPPPPTPSTSGDDPGGQSADPQGAAQDAALDAVSVPTAGQLLLVQARNPDTNGMIDVAAHAILAGDVVADGSVTVDVWIFDLIAVRRETVQLYATRDDALASDRPAGHAAWWPPALPAPEALA